ncbi:hypothetical protein ABZZ20_30445 [Streptomyces sp. NPDC006430]|uniref:hypothetical protein n=1 Tax=Streptomyces sp. NPDC006430 TaxID=3154299 RepID=UPI0033BF142D
MSDARRAVRHNLRFENHSTAVVQEEGQTRPWPVRVPTGETTVTCACGLDTGAIPTDNARMLYEQHRYLIRDEIAANG